MGFVSYWGVLGRQELNVPNIVVLSSCRGVVGPQSWQLLGLCFQSDQKGLHSAHLTCLINSSQVRVYSAAGCNWSSLLFFAQCQKLATLINTMNRKIRSFGTRLLQIPPVPGIPIVPGIPTVLWDQLLLHNILSTLKHP